ncbi:formate dehydrogenase accessory sulfurtransferase FdhD [Tenacibaculum sp. C7A-26P2]|uniref:formate dehydrogenase accessory sulfurtransferase FdhD n=1 Tax=Tenacibaculum sp. C7A-26P2 TaxID=3447504 RepID=UPI003F833D23
MVQIKTYDAIKISCDISSELEDNLVVEAPLQININSQPYTVVMRTPGNDKYLIQGLLFAEDIYKKPSPIKIENFNNKESFGTIINVIIAKIDLGNGYLNKRTLLSVSSCGICGKKEINDIKIKETPITKKIHLTFSEIKQMFATMNSTQTVFQLTGGSHASAVFNKNKNLLTSMEDIGRHNAVDKCIGYLIQSNKLNEATIILVSGRVSYEIISKAFFAKIPIIIAVSACSSLAVDFAKEFGICLIGFTRNKKMTIYSHPHTIHSL